MGKSIRMPCWWFRTPFCHLQTGALTFTDLDRLAKIVNNPDRPYNSCLQEKAHPHDGARTGINQKNYRNIKRPEFLGKIIFLENYDMQLARRLVTGVDIWLKHSYKTFGSIRYIR